jgi:hypothetical protein
MEFATIVESVLTVGPELLVLFFVLIGLYNKNILVLAKRLARADPAGKALNIIDNADVDDLSRTIMRAKQQIEIADARKDGITPEQKEEIYKGVENAIKKKSLSK